MVVMARPSRSERPDLVFEEEDLPYEEEIMRNQFSVKCWLRYIEFKQGAPKPRLNQLYERALKLLPCSYKLWYRYLKARRAQVKHRCVTDPAYEDVNNCHERAFVFMHKMPRLWLDYCQFLMDQGRVTHTRRTFDRALRALPITQHSRVWPLYLRFLRSHPLPETAVRGYRRFLKLSPESAEEYIEYLKSSDRLDEAAQRLATVVNDERFVSKAGKSNYQLWHELCDLISQNPDKVQSLNVDAIIRGGLTRFTDQLGKLWCSLADYYIRSGHFEKARDVYEEAIRTVMTVRDFTQVFDSYAQFEESMIAAKMETASELGREEEDDVDLELRLARFEQLIARRPLLLNSVLLRQNPHHVHEWHKRVALHQGRPREIINTYTEAVQTVDPFKATGKPHTLWVAFAKFYEDNGQLDDARVILEKATKKATALPARRAEYFDASEPVQNRVYKSLKVWSMLADLEESLGTFQSTKAVYDRILDLRIATPQIVINYAMFLEEHKYFEESFKAYERGISLFKWPNVSDIWSTYLTKFIARYGGRKLERARDLFEQALDGCPPKYAKTLYLLYAQLEEEWGLARHAMAVYERATRAVEPAQQYDMFNIYIKRAAEIYGVTHTRGIYQKAIEVLSDEHAREMCLRFADMECKLGEIDRARAIYSFCSQICDPRTTGAFWQTWKDFEVRHGNEDTIREMLRIRRSVQATYNTQVNFMASQMLKVSGSATGTVSDLAPGQSGLDDMKLLEQRAEQLAAEAERDQPPRAQSKILFVRSDASREELAELAQQANPEEIELGEDEDEDEMDLEPNEVRLEQQSVPAAVFGSLKED
ncbi:pre-mRNA-splicing factor SYF1 isoform X2 [Diceros bicornis minor]|uniref:pre-mRNA-splicing factor SYF1 isoform X2 n=1 Tax=Diceros bicornis minor TaxID=77932 RepID=UPI0026F0213D|nr:pre-mRNA-splicing factor SYF1 isoform X2 [Diceros bicornis minor]